MRARPGPTLAVGISAALIGGLALTLRIRDAAPPVHETCPAAAAIHEHWNAQVRDELHYAFDRTGRYYARASAQTTDQLLDRYARQWSRARQDTCEPASPGRRKENQRRGACLDGLAHRFAALVDRMREADARTVEHAVDATLTLPSLSRCAWAPPALEGPLTRTLDTLEAGVAVHEHRDAANELDTLAERTDLHPRHTARIDLLRGRIERRRDAWAKALSMDEQSLWAAIEGHDDSAVLDAALASANAAAAERDPALAQRWWRLASAWVTRLGRPPEEELALLRSQARLLARAQAWPLCLGVVERAVRLAEHLEGPKHPTLLAELRLAMTASLRVGQLEFAQTMRDRALDLVTTQWGRRHPHWASVQREFATAALAHDDADPSLAMAALRAILETDEAFSDAPAPQLTFSDARLLGQLAASRGEHALAQRAFSHARARRAAAEPPPPPDVALAVDLGLASAALANGQPEIAQEALTEAIEHQRELDASPEERSTTAHALAQSYLDQGRHADARQTLEAALAGLPDDPSTADARAALLVARSEASLPDAPAEAEAWARRALEHLREMSSPVPDARLRALSVLGRAALQQARPDAALHAFEAAASVAEQADPPMPGRLAAIRLGLASAAWEAGERARARAIVDALASQQPAYADDSGPTLAELEAWTARREATSSHTPQPPVHPDG